MLRVWIVGFLLGFCFLSTARADGVDDAAKALKDAILKDDAAAEGSAVKQLVDLGDPRGLPALHGALIDMLPQLHKWQTELATLELEYERKKEKLDRLRAGAATDEDKKSDAKKAELGLKEWVEKTLEPMRKRVGKYREARDVVTKGSADLIAKLAPDKRKSESDRLAKLVQAADHTWEDRVAAMECIALVGDPAVFSTIWKVGNEARKERKKLLAELPEKEQRFETEHLRFLTQVEKQGNRYAVGQKDLLDKAEREVKELQEKIFAQTQLMDASVRLVPVAINGLAAASQQKAISELIGIAKGNDPMARLAAIEALGGVPDPGVRTALRALLSGGDPGTRVAALGAVMRQRDEGAVDTILEKCMKDEEWSVRASAIQALAKIRTAKSIPNLIAAYENEVGRLRDDAQDALESLTGQSFGSPAAWKSWWEKNQSFTPPESQPSRKRGPRTGETGVAFAGIQSASKNICFVVDVSGSMNYGLEAEAPPNEGKPTRFALLKKELESAIEHMPEGGKFSIITFSTAATRWQPQALPVNPQNKQKALEFVRKEMVANGGTNIYAALKEAFDIAGIGATDKYYRPAIDTIFFLTDGTPSPDTEITDPERLLAFVRERNKLGKLTFHVVCLGEADATFLRRLAEENHGEFAKP